MQQHGLNKVNKRAEIAESQVNKLKAKAKKIWGKICDRYSGVLTFEMYWPRAQNIPSTRIDFVFSFFLKRITKEKSN